MRLMSTYPFLWQDSVVISFYLCDYCQLSIQFKVMYDTTSFSLTDAKTDRFFTEVPSLPNETISVGFICLSAFSTQCTMKTAWYITGSPKNIIGCKNTAFSIKQQCI